MYVRFWEQPDYTKRSDSSPDYDSFCLNDYVFFLETCQMGSLSLPIQKCRSMIEKRSFVTNRVDMLPVWPEVKIRFSSSGRVESCRKRFGFSRKKILLFKSWNSLPVRTNMQNLSRTTENSVEPNQDDSRL